MQSARDDLREVEGKFLELSGWEEISEVGMWRHPDFAVQGQSPHFKHSNPIFAQKVALAVAEAFYAAGRRPAGNKEEAKVSLSLQDESLTCSICGNNIPPGAVKIAVDAQNFRHPDGSPLCRRTAAAKESAELAATPVRFTPTPVAIAKAKSLLAAALDEATRMGVEVRFSFTTVGGQQAWYLVKGVEDFHFGEIH